VARIFQQAESPNQCIIEYLAQPQCVDEYRRDIPDKIFAAIVDQYHLTTITRYTAASLDELALEFRYKLESRHSMRHIENDRTGINTYFLTDASGWISVARFSGPRRNEKTAS
jgi:hypothetical protein